MTYIEGQVRNDRHFWENAASRNAKPLHIIQLNYQEMSTHANCETPRT